MCVPLLSAVGHGCGYVASALPLLNACVLLLHAGFVSLFNLMDVLPRLSREQLLFLSPFLAFVASGPPISHSSFFWLVCGSPLDLDMLSLLGGGLFYLCRTLRPWFFYVVSIGILGRVRHFYSVFFFAFSRGIVQAPLVNESWLRLLRPLPESFPLLFAYGA